MENFAFHKLVILLAVLVAIVAAAGFLFSKTEYDPAIADNNNGVQSVPDKNNGSIDLVRPPFLDE